MERKEIEKLLVESFRLKSRDCETFGKLFGIKNESMTFDLNLMKYLEELEKRDKNLLLKTLMGWIFSYHRELFSGMFSTVKTDFNHD